MERAGTEDSDRIRVRGRLFAQWKPAIGGSLDAGAGDRRGSPASARHRRGRPARRRRGGAAQSGLAATPTTTRRHPAQVALMEGTRPSWPIGPRADRRHRAHGRLRADIVNILLRGAMCRASGADAAEHGGRPLARRVPRATGVISPFNFPLIPTSRAVAGAATGNGCAQACPRTALTGGFIIARLFEEAGLPMWARCRCRRAPRPARRSAPIRHRDGVVPPVGGRPALRRFRRRHPKKVRSSPAAERCGGARRRRSRRGGVGLRLRCPFHRGQICMTTGLIIAHGRSPMR